MLISEEEKKSILHLLAEVPLNKQSEFSAYNYYVDYINVIEGDINHLYKGASKVAIELVNHPDWIIKIPFNGTHIDEKIYWDMVDRGEINDEEPFDFEHHIGFVPFLHAFDDIDWGAEEKWNYCEVENRVYEWAKNEELEDFFIETEYIGDINGYPIYIQEKVIPWEYVNFEKYNYHFTPKEEEQALALRKEFFNYHTCSSFYTEWYKVLLKSKDIDIVYKLIDFLLEYELSDFHMNNYGIREKEHLPVFFDYCGFRDNQDGLTDYDSEF